MGARIVHNILLFAAVAMCATAGYGQLIPNLGGQRAGISALPFLKIGSGARGVAMGESFVAVANDATALYWNPAGLTQFPGNQFTITHTWYVEDFKHDFLGIVYHTSPNEAIGFGITSLRTDDMEITTETQPFGTGNYFSYSDFALAGSYSRKMTDQFSFGVTVRYVNETLAILNMTGWMMDLGTYYWTGIGSTRFAVVVSNFGADVAPTGQITGFDGTKDTSFQSFSPPTQFKLGFAFEPVDESDKRLTTSVELNHPNDNAENVHLGLEYQWEKWFWLRAGAKRTIGEPLFGQDNTSATDVTFGFGVATPIAERDVTFDYAFQNFHELGVVHRISLAVTY